MSRPFERVYAVTNFLDQVRNGSAAFDGVPHTFDAVLSRRTTEYLRDTFDLCPVDGETLALALEDAAIVERYHAARLAGALPPNASDASLPADRARHAELGALLARRLRARPHAKVRVTGVFRRASELDAASPARPWNLEVQWTPAV